MMQSNFRLASPSCSRLLLLRICVLLGLLVLPNVGEAQSLCNPNAECLGTFRLQSHSQYHTVCIGDTAEILLYLCFTSDSQMDTSVEVRLNLSGAISAGVGLIGGDFSFEGINYTDIDGTSDCIPLTVHFYADTNVVHGDVISIPIAVAIPSGYCDRSDSVYSTIKILAINCDSSTCLCPDEPENINLKGSNIKLSRLISAGFFGSSIFPVIPPCLSINGTLIVDVPFFQIDNCEIILGASSEIQVLDNCDLHLRNNYIHGCDYLWKSIAKKNNGVLLADNNSILDGAYALSIYSETPTSIPIGHFTNNIFNRNHVGIFGGRELSAEIKIEKFHGNEFSCTNGNLLPALGTNIAFPDQIGRAHV